MTLSSPFATRLGDKKVLVWMRRDLRLEDHAALSAALSHARQVWCVFVFDRDILQPLLTRGLSADRRVEFIHLALQEIDQGLREKGSALIVRHDAAQQAIPALAHSLGIEVVVANHDYEPAAIERDARVAARLQEHGIGFVSFKDQVIFERDEVLTANGHFYSVFTPYKRAWLKRLQAGDYAERCTFRTARAELPRPAEPWCGIPSLEQIGFRKTNLTELGLPLGIQGANTLLAQFSERIAHYRERRDFPAVKGPSYLSMHLRFGTVSIRSMVRLALAQLDGVPSANDPRGAATWLSELIWRDFYAQVLYHRQDLTQHAFRSEYDQLQWHQGEQADALFAAWCAGQTGYPLVDAAMRQINSSGYMHNRLRMVTASFLVKDLGLDWRRGEAYFADQLNDFDLASNNGGWQWSASTGCDAQPYFRIFNPVSQSEKFDPEGKFIRLYVPELAALNARQIHAPWQLSALEQQLSGVQIGKAYPAPVIDHAKARQDTLQRYARSRA